MSDTPEMERLLDRLFPKDGPKIRNIHFDWGPRAHTLTTEARARIINAALDDAGAGVDIYIRADFPEPVQKYGDNFDFDQD